VELDAIVESVSRTGVTKIRFSQIMHVPANWTNISGQVENGTWNETIELYLVLEVENNSNIVDHLLHIFYFNLTEFTPRTMTLQLNFSNPEYISNDQILKDRLIVKVLQSNVFVTIDTKA